MKQITQCLKHTIPLPRSVNLGTRPPGFRNGILKVFMASELSVYMQHFVQSGINIQKN